MIFDEREYSALAVDSGSNSSPTIEESLISHPLYQGIHDFLGLFSSDEAERVLGRIESTTEEQLCDIVNVIPDEWEVKDTEKESIIKHYLLPRKNVVRGFYQQLLVDAKIKIP